MKITCTLMLLLICLLVSAQKPQKHIKKSFNDTSGRLFMNKHLPVYLWIGNSLSEDVKKNRLKSESTPQYANPFYFDTEGINTVRTPSRVDTITKKLILPEKDIIFEVYADGIAPESNISLKDAKKYCTNKVTYYGKGLTAKISSDDRVSGTEQLLFSVDESDYAKYSNDLLFEKEKEYLISYYGVDNVGNVEQPNTCSFQTDFTAPKVNHTWSGSKYKNIVSAKASISLHAEDSLSGVKYISYLFDGQASEIYRNKICVIGLKNEKHILKYTAIDNVGNKSDINKVNEEFIVDDKAPLAKAEIVGDQYIGLHQYVSARTKIKLTAEDDHTPIKWIKYIVAPNETEIYKAPFSLVDKNGWQSVSYKASDMVDNVSPIRKMSVYLDNKSPVTGVKYSNPKFFTRDTLFINSKTNISLFVSDDASGVKNTSYKLNEEEWLEGKKLNIEKDGFYTLSFKSKDNVNNKEIAKKSRVFVDNEPPVIYNRFSIDPIRKEEINGELIEIYPPYVNLYLSATDKACGTKQIMYQVDGGKILNYASPGNPSEKSIFKAEKIYMVKITAYDMLNNSSEKEFTFKISKK